MNGFFEVQIRDPRSMFCKTLVLKGIFEGNISSIAHNEKNRKDLSAVRQKFLQRFSFG